MFFGREEIAMFLGQTRHEGGADATRQEEICVAEGEIFGADIACTVESEWYIG